MTGGTVPGCDRPVWESSLGHFLRVLVTAETKLRSFAQYFSHGSIRGLFMTHATGPLREGGMLTNGNQFLILGRVGIMTGGAVYAFERTDPVSREEVAVLEVVTLSTETTGLFSKQPVSV
jgi:hypothetical protein